MTAENPQALLKTRITTAQTFHSAVFSGARKGQTVPWPKVTLRPVDLKAGLHWQFSYWDGRQTVVKNFTAANLVAPLDELLALPFKSITVRSAAGDVRVQFSKRGKAIVHQDNSSKTSPPSLSHDRPKRTLLPPDKPDPFLQKVGIMTADGRIKANMRDKFWQVNQFLQLIDQTPALHTLTGDPLRVVDCGCGSAYLTFAVYHYLSHILGRNVQMMGIDLKADLLNQRSEQAQALGWMGLRFEPAQIATYAPAAPPDIMLALHACDTATDEALAQAIGWQSKLIFSVPCCHHHLQAQLPAAQAVQGMAHAPLLRHGILKERLGDILTDSFRALILRIMGYKTDVVEFVSSEHTPKNIMIRAVQCCSRGDAGFMREYAALKAQWGVTPYLETLLGESFSTLDWDKHPASRH